MQGEEKLAQDRQKREKLEREKKERAEEAARKSAWKQKFDGMISKVRDLLCQSTVGTYIDWWLVIRFANRFSNRR